MANANKDDRQPMRRAPRFHHPELKLRPTCPLSFGIAKKPALSKPASIAADYVNVRIAFGSP
jgi:hypothetical protein